MGLSGAALVRGSQGTSFCPSRVVSVFSFHFSSILPRDGQGVGLACPPVSDSAIKQYEKVKASVWLGVGGAGGGGWRGKEGSFA